MRKRIATGRMRPGPAVRKAGLCFMLAVLSGGPASAGCSFAGGEDAGRLLEKTLAVMEERGLSSVPVETDAGGLTVEPRAREWNPFGEAADLAKQAAAVTVTRAGGGQDALLAVELTPEAAKALLGRRLEAELEAIRRQSAGLAASGGAENELVRRIDRRIDDAKREAAALLAEAEVETVIRLRVDRRSAVPSAVCAETRIVRPAKALSAAEDGPPAEPRPAGRTPGWQETIIDNFLVIGQGEEREP